MRKLQDPSSKHQHPDSVRRPGRNYTAHFWFQLPGHCLELGAWGLVLLVAFAVQGQPITNSSSSRYLLVLNTSRTMEPRAAGVQKAITDLLGSGMGGQLRRGDTIGIWTFNEDLYTGRFPLQRWSPETKEEIILNLGIFLKNQKYEKKAALDKVLPPLEKIIQASPFITVVLVSDGDEKIRGTPFDAQINKYYGLWRDQQRKAQMPLLCVLRARSGEITHFAMNTAPWPVEMPPLAPEIKALADAEKNASKAPRTSSVPPLIISGKKLREERGEADTDASAPPGGPRTSGTAISNIGRNQIVLAGASTNPASQESIHQLPASATTNGLTPAALVEPVATTPDAARSEPAQPAKIDPIVSQAKADTAEVSKQTDTQPTTSSFSSSELAQTNSNPATVAAAPPPPSRNYKIILLGGIIVIGGAWAAAVLWLRRSRAAPRISLITRSLEREKKL